MSSRPPHPTTPTPGGSTAGALRSLSIEDLHQTTSLREEALEGPNAFLYALFQVLKTASIHAPQNEALRRPVHRMAALTARTTSTDGRLSFQVQDGACFINSTKLKLSSEEYRLAEDLFAFFAERGLGGLVVEDALDEGAVRRFLEIVVYAPRERRTFEAIDAALKESGLPLRASKARPADVLGEADLEMERRAYTFLTYSKAVVLYRTLLAEEKPDLLRRKWLMKKLSRTVQTLVDICVEDDHTFLGLSAVKSGDEYASHHAVNTAVLSIVLGHHVGLTKVRLADLGMAAIFHDFGMRGVPQAILDKAGKLDPTERGIVAHYLLESVEYQLGEKTLGRSALSRIAVAFDHHRRLAGTHQGDADLFSRIVQIATVYDALTTDRPWRKAYLPDEALRVLLYESEGRFDPVLTKVFVNALGLYPVGTLVRLTTDELAVVVFGGGEGERASRPVVAVLGPDGRAKGSLDLMEKDVHGRYLREIVHSEDPRAYGLSPSAMLVAPPVS